MLLWTLSCMLLAAQESVSEKAQCYQSFDVQHGSCDDLMGEAEVEDCCLNPDYGFKDTDGVCQSCRLASWTDWSPWGSCTRSCLEGVQQRKRFCYGIGDCKDPHKLGSLQTRPCEDSSCCPEQGGWAEWGQWQPCSVSCETGQKLRERTCSSPPPFCGGSCSGQGKEYASCDTGKDCPVHGSWSDWGAWGPCAASCANEGSSPPLRYSVRTCTNPTPSDDPPGLPCTGQKQMENYCQGLPYCAVHGGWGPWSAFSECPVTCGLGLTVRTRTCSSPAPKHGGQPCPGDSTSTQICNTQKPCPVKGEWAEWAEWSLCKRANKNIRCKTHLHGIQWRQRKCEPQDRNKTHCLPIDSSSEKRYCYDIEKCPLNGNWSEWSNWSLCQPNCGPQAQKTRKRVCVLDVSMYTKMEVEETIVRFAGKAWEKCVSLKEEEKTMSAPCLNVPPCT